MRYLIDGYNLAHWLVRDDSVRPEGLRRALLAALRECVPGDAQAVEIYWDVRSGSRSLPSNEYLGWCTCHFVPDADAAIIDRVYRADQARRVTVVSRDREVTGRSRQLGARILGPVDLLGRR